MSRPTTVFAIALVLGLAVLALIIAGLSRIKSDQAPPIAQEATHDVVLAVGDIASCENDNDEATAKLLDSEPGIILTLGDNAYPEGTLDQFQECFEPTWGRHKSRIFPSIGNHEYRDEGAAGFFTYFQRPRPSYYSFDSGGWHFVALDNNCTFIDCAAGSAQETWLRTDLAATSAQCILAYMHVPRFSTGRHGNDEASEALWQALYDYKVNVVLAAHDHTYERFAPMRPDGTSDPVNGIRSFIVGTGGKSLYDFESSNPNSVSRNNDTYGVLKLVTAVDSYSWEFLPVEGSSFTDSGSGACR
jgi:acid phosphatase type 7